MKATKIDFFPLFAIILYISIGVALSFWGPIIYTGYEKLSVVAYMLAFLLLFSIGYTLGLVGSNNRTINIHRHDQHSKFQTIIFWVKISIVIITIVQLVNLILSLYDGTLNLSISKMGEAYINLYKNYERGKGNIRISFLIQTLTYIPYLVTLILGAFYFKKLPKAYKYMVVFSYISIILLETIGHGKQKQLGDILVFISIVFLLRSDLTDPVKRKKLLKKLFLFGILGIALLITVLYFRYSALNIDRTNINDVVHPLMKYDTDSIIFSIFGDKFGFALAAFSGYLSQGYYGLSLCMQEPFEWTYFMGNSYSLTVFMNRFLGVPVDFHDTYPYRTGLHTAWDDSKWSTVFSWFAGDFTFVGTLFVFALIAFFYAKVWKEAYRYHNPISIILFANLTIGMLYIPANNQLLHTPGSVIAMFFFFSVWLFTHKKFNFYKKV